MHIAIAVAVGLVVGVMGDAVDSSQCSRLFIDWSLGSGPRHRRMADQCFRHLPTAHRMQNVAIRRILKLNISDLYQSIALLAYLLYSA